MTIWIFFANPVEIFVIFPDGFVNFFNGFRYYRGGGELRKVHRGVWGSIVSTIRWTLTVWSFEGESKKIADLLFVEVELNFGKKFEIWILQIVFTTPTHCIAILTNVNQLFNLFTFSPWSQTLYNTVILFPIAINLHFLQQQGINFPICPYYTPTNTSRNSVLSLLITSIKPWPYFLPLVLYRTQMINLIKIQSYVFVLFPLFTTLGTYCTILFIGWSYPDQLFNTIYYIEHLSTCLSKLYYILLLFSPNPPHTSLISPNQSTQSTHNP